MTTRMDELRGPHLSLVAHCLTAPGAPLPRVHPELFISVAAVDQLLAQLADAHFRFVLPGAAQVGPGKTCSFTFDDGYANNRLFLPMAEKYRLPVVLFVNSLNIANQLPFLWDALSLAGAAWKPWFHDYRQAYSRLDSTIAETLLADDNHRPFTLSEFEAFAENPWVSLALHTHHHQPLVGKFLTRAEEELEANAKFLRPFPRVLSRDLALPGGLYTPWTAMRLRRLVDRIYTIDGGGVSPGAQMVHRISLINPQLGGSLISQITRSFDWRVKLRRKVANVRYSASMLADW